MFNGLEGGCGRWLWKERERDGNWTRWRSDGNSQEKLLCASVGAEMVRHLCRLSARDFLFYPLSLKG
jgi:hypothetical protein